MKCNIPYHMTNRQAKACQAEIDKQIAQAMHRLSRSLYAVILCVLREQTGWGRERLCRFAEELVPRMMDLTERYELPEQSLGWLCEEKISALGVDLDAIVQKAQILRGTLK